MLSRIAREMAAEIASHDWSDSPYRLDRAGHQRSWDSPGRRIEQPLDKTETDFIRTNVMWATAQVLKHADPNLDVYEYAAACGVPRSITHRNNGSKSGAISYGLRWEDTDQTRVSAPGAPLWQVQVHCEVANLVVFKRVLDQVDGFDPSQPPTVESVGGAMRNVTVTLRDWHGVTAGERAVAMVGAASLSVMDGGPATLVDVQPADC
jgi:hypothetical protein